MNSFADHFSKLATTYAQARPRYPAAVFEYLAGLVPRRDVAWDAGTGNGQAATGLAGHFHQVIATDASAQQIAAAPPQPNIEYRVAKAEESGLPDASVDLITVAQALHWFDRPRFYREARRVARPGGLLAVWCYAKTMLDPEIDEVVEWFYTSVVGPYWPAERCHVEDGYVAIDFPFDELPQPQRMFVEVEWNLPDMLAYLRSWSATQGYIDAHGDDPRDQLIPRLASAWGPADRRRLVRWPLHLRIGRLDSKTYA